MWFLHPCALWVKLTHIRLISLCCLLILIMKIKQCLCTQTSKWWVILFPGTKSLSLMIPDHNLWYVVTDTGLEGVCAYNWNNTIKRKAGHSVSVGWAAVQLENTPLVQSAEGKLESLPCVYSHIWQEGAVLLWARVENGGKERQTAPVDRGLPTVLSLVSKHLQRECRLISALKDVWILGDSWVSWEWWNESEVSEWLEDSYVCVVRNEEMSLKTKQQHILRLSSRCKIATGVNLNCGRWQTGGHD